MPHSKETGIIYTIKDKCRLCYTCVRECPAKAIRVVNGQAQIISYRCIACGNCTKVCSQGAKTWQKSIDLVEGMLAAKHKVIALVAPSFPAEFPEITDYRQFVGLLKEMGFDKVLEVAFGADLVAREYKRHFSLDEQRSFISSDCPAIVNYIRMYHPEMVHFLVPVVSPMVAIARVARAKYGHDDQLVFIGPCIAKKEESEEIDAKLSFAEFREMVEKRNLYPQNVPLAEFDPPRAGKGVIFPVSRGLVETAGVNDNLVNGNVIVAEGRLGFQEAIKEFESGFIRSRNLELLCCQGCIMGPGMSPGGKLFNRQALVSAYARAVEESGNRGQWELDIEEFSTVDLHVEYVEDDRRIDRPTDEELAKVLEGMGKMKDEDHLNCGVCGYDSCVEHAIAVIRGLAEPEMCLPHTIDKLHGYIGELAVSNEKLQSMQQALRQSEKLAHMGQLSAGIAHELNNPLGVVIMYTNILLDECGDTELQKDLKLIVEQATRCKHIVSGLLNFARKSQVNHDEVDIRDIARKSLATVIIPREISLEVIDCARDHRAVLDTEQMVQALSNLIRNAIDAMPNGGKLILKTEDTPGEVIFRVKDTGTGIAEEDMNKVFEPFYTTKGIGKGTGLGLATTYGIVKMHKGKIKVSSRANPDEGPTGTSFKITLPRDVAE